MQTQAERSRQKQTVLRLLKDSPKPVRIVTGCSCLSKISAFPGLRAAEDDVYLQAHPLKIRHHSFQKRFVRAIMKHVSARQTPGLYFKERGFS